MGSNLKPSQITSFLTRWICMAESASLSSFPAFLADSLPVFKQSSWTLAQVRTEINPCRDEQVSQVVASFFFFNFFSRTLCYFLDFFPINTTHQNLTTTKGSIYTELLIKEKKAWNYSLAPSYFCICQINLKEDKNSSCKNVHSFTR